MPIIRYTDLDKEVIPFIRARPKPLALYMFGTDTEQNERMLRMTSSGGAIINDVIMHLSNPELPFGGVQNSGMGSYRACR
jgi:aldehyde dehydrogenase (NAD+)